MGDGRERFYLCFLGVNVILEGVNLEFGGWKGEGIVLGIFVVYVSDIYYLFSIVFGVV